MTRGDAMGLARELWRLHEQEVELRVTLAKFAASAVSPRAGGFDG